MKRLLLFWVSIWAVIGIANTHAATKSWLFTMGHEERVMTYIANTSPRQSFEVKYEVFSNGEQIQIEQIFIDPEQVKGFIVNWSEIGNPDVLVRSP